jgi:hypothetical protein
MSALTARVRPTHSHTDDAHSSSRPCPAARTHLRSARPRRPAAAEASEPARHSNASPAPLLLLGRMHHVNDLVHHRRIRQLPSVSLHSKHPTRVALRSTLHPSQTTREYKAWLTVVVSPSWSSSPARILRRMRRMIFPDRVLGRSGTTKMALGAANGPIDLRTCRIRSFFVWSESSWPSLSATNALTACPVSSSLTPTTAASATLSVKIRQLGKLRASVANGTYGAR